MVMLKLVVKETMVKMATQSGVYIQCSSQSEGYSSKWLIWLMHREPLLIMLFMTKLYKEIANINKDSLAGLPLVS